MTHLPQSRGWGPRGSLSENQTDTPAARAIDEYPEGLQTRSGGVVREWFEETRMRLLVGRYASSLKF